jgi:hypothetical protein
MILPILDIIIKSVNNMYKSAYKFGLFVMASLIMLSTVATALPMGNMNLFSDVMTQEKITMNMTIIRNTKAIILTIMINTDQIMVIIIIIKTSRNKVIATTMVMKTIKKYLMTIVMIMIIANIVIILQKTKNMSVKQDNLKASLSNQ